MSAAQAPVAVTNALAVRPARRAEPLLVHPVPASQQARLHCAPWEVALPSRCKGPRDGRLSTAAAAALATGTFAVVGRRRQGWSKRSRRLRRTLTSQGLVEDALMVAEELASSVEDAALHVSRIGPWLSGSQPDEAEEKATGKRRIVVLGTGWAGHALTKVLDPAVNDVCVVSPRNYFVFTPLLAAASVGTVEYRSILEHIRSSNPTVRFFECSCQSVDLDVHKITVTPVCGGTDCQAFELQYDTLVVAVGSQSSSRGVPGVDEHCVFLKSIDDARDIRRRVTECFEYAELPELSEEERRQLLTFMVVGGGPTGCEFCGELCDFVRNDLNRFHPKLTPYVRIVLVHSKKEVLNSFGDEMQQAARQTLESQGIEIISPAKVVKVDKKIVTIQRKEEGAPEEKVPFGLCLWAAGQGGVPIIKEIRSKIPEQKAASEAVGAGESQLFTDDWMRVVGVRDGSMIALGDCARLQSREVPLPATAQVAAQQGAYVARLLNRNYDLKDPEAPKLPAEAGSAVLSANLLKTVGEDKAMPFRFLDLGKLAYLGDEKALADVNLGSTSVAETSGRAAFFLWRSVYLVKQVSFRNRVLVLFDWVKSKLFGRDLTRF
eukprot:TRINITY_DN38181_c0_g1_i1.p1 TRINITY_DN38181_c0_g1~~TRINITY_DN38181_c0_g1_i1.p1  ORF type:complete len:634 (-),score=152.87 TRINITY_DN38181_c0_g1_i1:401-2215(-)